MRPALPRLPPHITHSPLPHTYGKGTLRPRTCRRPPTGTPAWKGGGNEELHEWVKEILPKRQREQGQKSAYAFDGGVAFHFLVFVSKDHEVRQCRGAAMCCSFL